MESKHIQRVTFAELADAKTVMVMVADSAEHKWGAYRMLVQMGMRPNSGAMVEARRDIAETLGLLIAVSEEFRRLHVDCDCPTTDAEIEQGTAELRERLAGIEREQAAAGPVDTNPAHAADDLRKFLGITTGVQVPEGFDRSEIPGLSSGEGTGFYF